MSRAARFLRNLRRAQRGAAAIEFGLLLVPLSICLMGLLDVGYMMYVRSVMQGAVNDVSRLATVEKPVFTADGNTVDAKIDAAIRARMAKLVKGGSYTIRKTSYYKFAGVGRAEKLLTDQNSNGQYDTGDCWEDTNPNRTFDLDSARSGFGGADDAVLYDVTVNMPRLLPMSGLIGMPANYTVKVKTLVRNQPYADQPKPKTECA